jgi:hypothetical protein
MKDAGVSQGITFRTLHDEEPVGSEVSGFVRARSVTDEGIVSCDSGSLALSGLIGSSIGLLLGLTEGDLGIIHLTLGESGSRGSVFGSGSSFLGRSLGTVSGMCSEKNKASMAFLILSSLSLGLSGDSGVVSCLLCLECDSSFEDTIGFRCSLGSSN